MSSYYRGLTRLKVTWNLKGFMVYKNSLMQDINDNEANE
jgi:hypothetical protein